jgi:broad specificity phosphatase PhoE
MATTTFDIIRHARTQWNDEHRIQGQTDIPLSDEGRIQVRRWTKRFPEATFDRMLVSDLTRAKETADILNEVIGAPNAMDPRLREQDWGKWAGFKVKELGRRFPQELQEQIDRGWEFCPPGGESRTQVLTRALSCFSDVARRYPGERILVVTHGGIIKNLLYHACCRRYLPSEETIIKDYHVHRFIHDGSTLTLAEANALDLEALP